MKKSEMYLNFQASIDGYPGCCGIEVVTGLDLEKDYYNDYEGSVYTKQQVFKNLLKVISKNRTARHIQLSLVTKYKNKTTGQADGLKEFLIDNGWKVVDEFVAPNHGNTLCVMCKTYSRRRNIKPSVTPFFYF